jgi:hypothetical protein
VSNWWWPQYAIALLAVFGFAVICVQTARDRDITSERATGKILFYVAYYAAYVYTLHAGMFW